MQNTATWVDTGFLVALFAANDSRHEAATAFMASNTTLKLHSVWPVIVETCFFLDNNGKQALMKWLERGAMTMHDITPQDLHIIRNAIDKYQNLDPDFTDIVLVTMADLSRVRQILTIDARDFSIYPFNDGTVFERLWIKIMNKSTKQQHDPEAWQLESIEQALNKIQTGNAKFASHKAVSEWLKSWGSENEKTAPICK